jgi:hypothetical protein
MAAAARVAGNVRLSDVFLTGAQLANDLVREQPEGPVELKATVSHRYVNHKIVAQKVLLVEIGAKVEFRIRRSEEDGQKTSPPRISIDVVYAATYDLPNPPIPETITDEAFTAFARVNGLFNCWPYLRQEIHRLSAAMNIPLVLPTLRIVSDIKESNNKTEVLLPHPSAAKSKKIRKKPATRH